MQLMLFVLCAVVSLVFLLAAIRGQIGLLGLLFLSAALYGTITTSNDMWNWMPAQAQGSRGAPSLSAK